MRLIWKMRLWLDELERLPEYSATLPTGRCTGKTWKTKRRDGTWIIMQYGAIHEKMIDVYRFEIVLRQGPRPEILPRLPFKTECTMAELR